VDMIAGTSAGAMTGIAYAAGLDADFAAAQFSADIRPSWFFRRLPRGNHWYLLYKYRRGHFDPMLRKYLGDSRLEQLAVPCLSVTVDLVNGASVPHGTGTTPRTRLRNRPSLIGCSQNGMQAVYPVSTPSPLPTTCQFFSPAPVRSDRCVLHAAAVLLPPAHSRSPEGPMAISPLAGKPAPAGLLIDPDRLRQSRRPSGPFASPT